MIRPPGATLTDFTSVCMRCGECVRVCPTQGLQPSLLEGGLTKFVHAAAGAAAGTLQFYLQRLHSGMPDRRDPADPIEEKQRIPIGLASINTDRCLAWGYNTICSVCEEICPLAEKAIRQEGAEVDGL